MKIVQETVIADIVQLEEDTWPEGVRASQDKFESRVKIFPAGVISARDDDGNIMGLVTSCIVSLDDAAQIKSWEDVTAHGYITNHNTQGNTLYVVSLGVSPNYQRRGVGQALIAAQAELGKRRGLKQLVLGCRVPDFHKHDCPIEDYLGKTREDGFSVDAQVRFYQKCGLTVVAIKSNYMEDDPESRNYGVVMSTSLQE